MNNKENQNGIMGIILLRKKINWYKKCKITLKFAKQTNVCDHLQRLSEGCLGNCLKFYLFWGYKGIFF